MKKPKMKVVMYLNHPPEKVNACTMYRNLNPMKYANKEIEIRYVDKVETTIDYNPVAKKVTNIKIDAAAIEWADIVVFSRHYDQVALMGCLVEVAERMGKVVVYETDDLLQKVADNIGKHAFDNNQILEKMGFPNWMIPRCDLLTGTTDHLTGFYRDEMSAKNVVTAKNCYDPEHWKYLYAYKKLREFYRKVIKGDKTIRIGWQGGNNHFLKNFDYLVEPLNELHKKYGAKFQFVVLSGVHPNVDVYGGDKEKRKFISFDFEHHESTNLWKFPRRLAEMDLDIGLVVVEDNEFSRGKSNIKWMEYGLLGIPAIASDCVPYRDTNAILVDNSKEQWIAAIEDLMFDEEKRAKIGEEARKMVSDYDIRKHYHIWVNAYRDALEAKNK